MNSGLCERCLRVAYLVTDMTILLGMDEKATMDVQILEKLKFQSRS